MSEAEVEQVGTKPTRGAINALVFQVQNKKIKKSKPMRGAINALVFQVQNKNKTKKRKPTRGAINALVFQVQNKKIGLKKGSLREGRLMPWSFN